MATKKASGSRIRKRITAKERDFADLMVDGKGPLEAARKIFGWRCEPHSAETRKAINLKNSARIKAYMRKQEEQVVRETEATNLFLETDELQYDKIRKFAWDRLVAIRDDDKVEARIRYNAIQALEKMSDPTTDSGLINMWLELLWRGTLAHCPRCHTTFPLAHVKNDNIKDIFDEDELEAIDDLLERRMEIVGRADKRKTPHPGQITALSAPERHLAGMGAARAGKSVLLAWLALLHFLIPGVELWVLARIYEDARSEVEYLRAFLRTLFYPYDDKLIKENFDSKTGELILTSKWGSELRIRSAKAKGSITGRELEAAFVAEPGWVPEDLYEELRARMSSRLGRIIMFGTPKGFGGILGRLLHATGRNEEGKIVRIPPEQRTIAAGAPWGQSLCAYNLAPEQNPEYVKSELEAARLELTDAEYDAEFAGIMSSQEGAKFPQVKPQHLIHIPFDHYSNCKFILGIDQGPKNFASCLLAYDGKKVVVAQDYFESDMNTMQWHMNHLRTQVPLWIKHLGGEDRSWCYTIFDVDPSIVNELAEFDRKGTAWPTEYTFRPKNKVGEFNQYNWRKETYEFINQLAALEDPDLVFEMRHAAILHDQVMRVQNKPENRESETGLVGNKGWVVSDVFRGDHVLDAFVMGMYTIRSNQVVFPPEHRAPGDPWAEARMAQEYQLRRQEAADLQGFNGGGRTPDEKVFREVFGRPRGKASWQPKGYSPYKDY